MGEVKPLCKEDAQATLSELYQRRMAELENAKNQTTAELNVIIGAIAECQHWLDSMKEEGECLDTE